MNIHALHSNFCSLLPVQLPSRMESHLWYVLPGEVLNWYFELLSSSERDNVLGTPGIELQKRALLARALVRTTISRYTNHRVDPRSLNFKKNSHGKPELTRVGRVEKCGWLAATTVAFQLLARFFLDSLWSNRGFSDIEIQRQQFIRLWSLKDMLRCAWKDIKPLQVKQNVPIEFTVWRTIPFVEEECVTGTDAAVPIGG